jgi:serine protease inhibitor
MAGGRPTKYDAKYPEQAYKLCLLGATDERIADFFGVNVDTIHEWKKVHKEFSDALKEGKEQADAVIAQSLFHRAKGYKHDAIKIFADPKTGSVEKVDYVEHYPPDTTACIFWLKNRQPRQWRDKVETELTGKDGGAVQIEATQHTKLIVERARKLMESDT